MITSGSKIDENKQEALKNILGISKHGGNGKYLGLPEQFGRKKNKCFPTLFKKYAK